MSSCLIARQAYRTARSSRSVLNGSTPTIARSAFHVYAPKRVSSGTSPVLTYTSRITCWSDAQLRPMSVPSASRITQSQVVASIRFASTATTVDPQAKTTRPPRSRRLRRLYYLLAFLAFSAVCYETIPPARRLLIASVRAFRLLKAVLLSVLDYKYTFLDWYPADKYSAEERKRLAREDRHACHTRSSERLYQALKASAGIFGKLGQHIASIQALPVESVSDLG
jgi:hypothetical protein